MAVNVRGYPKLTCDLRSFQYDARVDIARQTRVGAAFRCF